MGSCTPIRFNRSVTARERRLEIASGAACGECIGAQVRGDSGGNRGRPRSERGREHE